MASSFCLQAFFCKTFLVLNNKIMKQIIDRNMIARISKRETINNATNGERNIATLALKYVPILANIGLPSTLASNVGKRSTLTGSPGLEQLDMLNCREKRVFFMEVNLHESPMLLPKRDSSIDKMSGSLLLNWEAFSILFMTITQSRSALLFSAVPFAMDPPYKDKATCRIYS